MSEFVVMVFPDETKAYQGQHALMELHDEGSVTVYATAVVRREADGTLSIKQQSPDGPIGTAVGTLVGALVGVFGGPAGMVAGMAGGALLGGTRDLIALSVDDDFLGETQQDLTPGKYAVVAEISEEWTAPLDIRMEALGGKVIRQEKDQFVDEQIRQAADAGRQSIKQWHAERAAAQAKHMEEELDAQLKREQKRLRALADKARNKLQERKAELGYKLDALQAQAAKATPDARQRIEHRIADLRRDFSEREQKLNRAYRLSQEALA